ncbi:Crp/Fnr family transcriptional regulator [Desulfovibrio mangrovi]|uniref:Crp/Fnr family transcriptional regulator n=1 Tax=Desulfovibrio mangrovi TaxID=2976983 RepID=UPI0022471D39|nr:Crp/Fnr family transcriptional regulator [Desulfovibrio mangrovi]UZP66789.1 Crp/Fnr family transcriptional regulator [Desulfovibrio mangrovi]
MKFSGVNLLDELEKEELAGLRAVFHERSFPKSQVIYAADDEEDAVFIIARGRVRVYLAYEDKEFTLGILSRGDIYSTHAGCYIQAMDDTVLLTTDVQSVKRVMIEVPLFNRTMVRVLGNILNNAFSIIGGLAFKDIYKRLISYILQEAEEHGVPEADGVELTLNLTIEQLAQLMGATRQTVSTLLNDMVRAELMQKRGRGRYLIPDLAALERAAGA